MEKKISINREHVLNAYQQATEEQKALLENMFGKDMFKPQNIMERVKTFEDACEELGEDHQYVKAYREWMRISYAECKDITAYLKLRIICAALNEGWKPKYNGYEGHHYTMFYMYTKKEYGELNGDKKKRIRVFCIPNRFASEHDGNVYAIPSSEKAFSNIYTGYMLTLKTEELANYCAEQFIDIWSDYLI